MTTTTSDRIAVRALAATRAACERRGKALDQVLDDLEADWRMKRRWRDDYPNPYVEDFVRIGEQLGIDPADVEAMCAFLLEAMGCEEQS